ncbi:IS1595 family transposase [Desulfobacula sp.]|uniref:IS1595 family transposase n=1 Tax=Desulfobacula sp. TaxID=2593537 RepID=UPI002631B1BE|nr:IS1595 family transposase [Desulfobacula sp.]
MAISPIFIVVIAIEIHEPMGFGRVRMQRIPDASADSLVPFVCNSVEPESNILTDSWRGYDTIEKFGYSHEKVNLSDSGDPAHLSLPGVHRVASLLKRWLLGTHQGAVSEKHLDYYLDEYTFCFNRRSASARGLLFYRLLEQALCSTPTTYREIVSKEI